MRENPTSKPVQDFLSQLSEAYLLCGKALQKKLPLQHPVLRALCALDRTTRGNEITLLLLRQLMSAHLRSFIPENIAGKLEEEARKFNVDSEVSVLSKQCTEQLEAKVYILKFWCHPLIKREYPCHYHVTRAAFTIFHGPQVESSFSLMQTVLTSSKSSTHISTFSAIQTLKYCLSNNCKSALELFGRTDKITPVNKMMCADIRASHGRYQRSLSEARRMHSSQTVLSAAQYDRAVKKKKSIFVEKEMRRKRKLAMRDLIERAKKKKEGKLK